MKKKIAALTITTFLLTGTLSYATQVSQKITAYFDNYTVSVNGMPINMTNKPFNYNGTIYVPMRSAAEALNAQIGYDELTKTVNIIPGSSQTEAIYMMQNQNLTSRITALNSELVAKNNEITDLKNKIYDLEKKSYNSSSSSSSSSSSRDAKDLEDRLYRDFEYYKNGRDEIRFSYKVYESRNSVDIELKSNIYKSDSVWVNRNKTDFQRFIEISIGSDIEKYFNKRNYDYYITLYDKDNRKIGDYTLKNGTFKVNDESN